MTDTSESCCFVKAGICKEIVLMTDLFISSCSRIFSISSQEREPSSIQKDLHDQR